VLKFLPMTNSILVHKRQALIGTSMSADFIVVNGAHLEHLASKIHKLADGIKRGMIESPQKWHHQEALVGLPGYLNCV
jgi:hypothetical protein